MLVNVTDTEFLQVFASTLLLPYVDFIVVCGPLNAMLQLESSQGSGVPWPQNVWKFLGLQALRVGQTFFSGELIQTAKRFIT